jgi:hypothetical protein
MGLVETQRQVKDGPVRLTRKDAAATALVAAAGAIYAGHLAGRDLDIVGSAGWTAVPVFLLAAASCSHGTGHRALGLYPTAMTGGAALALPLTLTAVVTNSEIVLAILMALVGVMWLMTTVRHVLGRRISCDVPNVPDGSHVALPGADNFR